jgi:hypothetical protein
MDSFLAAKKDVFLYIPRMKVKGDHPLQEKPIGC